MEFSKRRRIALAACMVTACFGGVMYSWSVYINPLAEKYGWSVSSISLAYTINVVFTALIPILCGRLRARLKTNRYVLIGVFLYSAGFLLCGFIRGSVLELYLYYGILVGGGIGFIYLSLASYTVQLFPEKKGAASGLFAASYASGALIWAPLANKIIVDSGDVSNAFRFLGLLFFVVLTLSSRLICEIPEGYEGEKISNTKGENRQEKKQVGSISEKSPAQLLKSPMYYTILFLYISGLISGMMIMSFGSPVVQGVLNYTPEQAAVIVGFFAIMSAAGRLIWGAVSDKMGILNVFACLAAIAAASLLTLSFLKINVLLIISLLAIPSCYGAYAALLAPVTAELFGAKHVHLNFNYMFLSNAFAALVGPQVISYAKSTGGYQNAFLFAAAFSVLSFILTFCLKGLTKKEISKLNIGDPESNNKVLRYGESE